MHKAYQLAMDGNPAMLKHFLEKIESKGTSGYRSAMDGAPSVEDAHARLANLIRIRHDAKKRQETSDEG